MRSRKPTLSLVITALCFIFSGCSIYKSSFDCPPGKGVGCVPTSEVLDMIVENNFDSDGSFYSGENLFIPDPRSCK